MTEQTTSFAERSFNDPKQYPIVIQDRVRWGDMDAFQHLNNTVYFKLFESARLAYFENIEFINYSRPLKIGPTLARTDCTFKKPLFYPCELLVGARVSSVSADRFVMQYAIFIAADPSRAAATGSGLIVCYNYVDQRKALLPPKIRDRIIATEVKCSEFTNATITKT